MLPCIRVFFRALCFVESSDIETIHYPGSEQNFSPNLYLHRKKGVSLAVVPRDC